MRLGSRGWVLGWWPRNAVLVNDTKDWVFIVGTVIVLVFALGSMLDEGGKFDRAKGSDAKAGYAAALLVLLCFVNFFEFRRALTERFEVGDVLS